MSLLFSDVFFMHINEHNLPTVYMVNKVLIKVYASHPTNIQN